MTRRLAITVLTVLALLWQGAVTSAMAVTMALSVVEAVAEMPCHEMAGMDDMAEGDDTAADHQAMVDCCGSSGHCVCATACGAAALAVTGFALHLLPSPDAVIATASIAPRASVPPHPFRPPIVSAV